MSDKIGRASTSKLRHALDLSIADPADEDVEDHGATTTLDVLKARAMLEEITKRLPVLDRDQPKTPHVSWTQRIQGWFSRH